MTSGDLRSFSQLAALVHEGAIRTDSWTRFLDQLRSQLAANAAVLIIRSPAVGQLPVIYMAGGSKDVEAEYYERFYALDPFVQLPEGRATTLHRFIAPQVLESSAFFLEYLAPHDSIYHLGVDVRTEGRYYARLRVSRSRNAGDYTDAEVEFADLFAPHLKSAIDVHFMLDQVRSERSMYADAMGQLTMGTLILDDAGKVIHQNSLAAEILAEHDGISIAHDMLVLSNREAGQRLRDMVQHAIATRKSGLPGLVEVLRIRRPSGKPEIGVIVRPSTLRLGAADQHLTAAVAVFLSVGAVSGQQREVPAEVIQKLFGLSPKEAELALSLTNGSSLKEAADQLGISHNTARSHLRSIFSKTGIDRQAMLVRAILKSVAMVTQ